MLICGWGLDPFGKQHVFTREMYDNCDREIFRLCFSEYVVWEPGFNFDPATHLGDTGIKMMDPDESPLCLEILVPLLQAADRDIIVSERSRAFSENS